MPKCRRPGRVVFQICMLFLLSSQGLSYGEAIREPVAAGTFYPASVSDLKQVIQHLTEKASHTEYKAPQGKILKALIMPHAGYIYSGLTAAHASLVLEQKQFLKVILMGPDHRVGFLNCAVSDVDAYQTPLGLVRLHQDAERLRRESRKFTPIPRDKELEHSIEVVLPFLQYYIGRFTLVPVVMGRVPDIEDVTRELLSIVDNKTLVVVSTDLSHYLSYPDAKAADQLTIQQILDFEGKKLSSRRNTACGIMPVLVLMKMAQKKGWKPVLIHCANSGDTSGNKNTVVGYATIAFYGDR